MIKKDDPENQDSSENPKKSAETKGKEIEWLDRFRFHHFLSLSKTKNMPYKEWQGETKNDEIVIVNYKEGVVIIGAGYNEIKARHMNLDINRIILFAAFVFMGAVFYYFINRMLILIAVLQSINVQMFI